MPDTCNEENYNESPEVCAVLPLEGENLLYVRLKFTYDLKRRALIDTGSCANALPESIFLELQTNIPNQIVMEDPSFTSVRMASGQKVTIKKQAKISFKIGTHTFQDSFLILPTMNSAILGNPFFKKYNITIDPRHNLLHLPDLTVQLNQILPEKGQKSKYTKKLPKIPLILTKKVYIPPQSQALLVCHFDDNFESSKNCTGLVIPSDRLEDKSGIVLTSSLSTIDDHGKVVVSAINFSDNPITLNNKTEIAHFEILNEAEADDLIAIDPNLISLAKLRNPDDFAGELNQLIQDFHFQKIETATGRPPPDYSKLWFPTPETCTDFSALTPLQREIYDQILQLQRLEKMKPTENAHDRREFLKKFSWDTCVLSNDQKEELEEFLVEYHDVFAKHRFDVGYNTELKIKLTPEHPLPVYVQGPPTPIHLRDELLVELALLQYFNIITTLSHSKYSSPIFVHRKASGKMRILIDLRRVNHLLRHDYVNSNFPISNMTDATNHFAGKKLFCKLDCSQAYHCVQMADDLSVQLLAFNFASRTFAYTCLAQGLNKSVTGFSSFVKHYLDPCLAANICTQFMDDIAAGVNEFDELIPVLRKIFDCLRTSGLKLSAHKCEFGTTKINYLGSTITPKGISPESEKIRKFLDQIRMPTTVKQVKRLIGFVQFFRNFMPNLGDKLLPFYRLLRKDTTFTITNDHHESLETLKSDLSRATNLTLRLAKPGLQYVILCDASYHGTGFVLMIEDYLQDQNGKEKKTYAPVSFGSRLFTATQLKFSVYFKEFLALYFALDHFSHFIWGATKPVLILTDNRSLTQFFQSKTIHPSLWNCLDRVLSFNILLAHIPGKANSAADFLSRMQTDPSLSIQIKLADHVPIREIEIETAAKTPDVALSNIEAVSSFPDELPALDQNFLNQLKIHGLYDQFLAKQPADVHDVIVHGLFSLKPVPQMNLIASNDFEDVLTDLPNRIHPLNLKEEQRKDEVITEVFTWLQNGKPDESLHLPIALRKYRKQFNRLEVRDDILYRLFYDDCGNVQYRQFCVPKHLWREVVFRLHNSKTAGHFGIAKTIAEFRKRFYFPNFTEFLLSTVKNCLSCLQLKRAPSKFLKPPLQPLSSETSFPGEMLQIDLVGPLQSPHYRYVLTAIDVFTKFLFAVPLTNARADTIARELVGIFFRHSYIPETILSDLGTTFVSELFHELTKLLEVQLKHASLNHPQTVGVVERSHGALKRILKLQTNEQWNDWYKYVPLAAFIHNTSFHSTIGCSPTALFHGREPIKPLDVRFNNRMIERFSPNSEYVFALQDAMHKKFSETKEKLTTMYNKYRTYYDHKAEAKPLGTFSYCLLLNPRLMTQSDFASKSLPIWLPLYRIEKVLTNSNYIIRKVGTNYTQCEHRIRLRPVEPQGRVDDLRVIDFQNFQRDPSLGQFRGEPYLFDASIPSLLDNTQPLFAPQAEPEVPAPVTVSLNFTPAPAIVPAAPVAGPALPPVAAADPGPAMFPDPVEVIDSPSDSPSSDNENTRSDSSNENLAVDPVTPNTFSASPIEPVAAEAAPDQPTTSRNLRQRLHPIYYGETRFKNTTQIPQMMRFQQTTTTSSGLTRAQEQKRQSILDSLERHRQTTSHSTMMQSSGPSPVHSSRPSTHSGQFETPPEYLRRQKEVKARYSLTNLKKRLSNNDVNAIVASTNYPKFCFSQSNILSTNTSFAYCGSSDLANYTGLAAAVSRRYPAVQNLHKVTLTRPPPGSLIACYDHSTNKFIYNLVTKRKFFHRSSYDTLQMSLLAMKRHMERHNITEIGLPRLGNGYDKLHWPTVFSLLYQIFFNSNIKIVIFQPIRS